ncbi:glycosyltransferase family protein [Schaalia sp. 19OD2882]|uniref:glycosyltransferase family protein n=1 Tax=Schaalia sp. 19OD2882 TaxID=2794089 RepID=UPI0020A82DA3|nr:glycosyltransferase [Schaalia sp. 19OD2882]
MLSSHDSLGLGHVRRNAAIAHRLADDLPQMTGVRVSGLLLTGASPALGLRAPDGFDWVGVPGVSKDEEGYRPRSLREDTSLVISLRSTLIEAALEVFRPDLVIIDRHLLGVHDELHTPLHALRQALPECRMVLGLREVLDDPAAAAREWARPGHEAALRDLVDEVWVYGDRAVHDLVSSGEVPAWVDERTEFTGYLATGRPSAPDQVHPPDDYVLTTVGGGRDGRALLEAAVAMPVPTGLRHLLVAGPQMPQEDLQRIRARAGAAVTVVSSCPDVAALVAGARAVVTMGGYNTICEVLAGTTPALVVPREHPRREQLIRARALQEVGAVDLVRSQDLSPQVMGRWCAHAVGRGVDRSHIARDGLARVSTLAARLLAPTNHTPEEETP